MSPADAPVRGLSGWLRSSVTALVDGVIPPSGPIRPFATANIVRTVGSGLILATSVFYLTRIVGLSSGQVGSGLSLAALVALLVGVPAGRLADVIGPKRTTIAFTVAQGVAIAGYVLISGFWTFAVVATAVACTAAATSATRGALLALALPPADRVIARAYMRAVSNVGVSFGALLGGGVLYLGTRPAYLGVFVVCGICLVLSALAYRRCRPRPAPAPTIEPAAEDRQWLEVFRDGPYLLITLLNAVLVSHDAILTIALPIWIGQQTNAPSWIYSVVVLVNTVLVVILQVRVSRGVDTVEISARVMRRAGVAIGASCVLFAFASGRPSWLAVVILLAGAAIHVVGELQQSAASWGLAFDLAPEHAQGQYQGLFGSGVQLSAVVMPLVVSLIVAGSEVWGWLVFALAVAVAGAAVPAASTWAVRRREEIERPLRSSAPVPE